MFFHYTNKNNCNLFDVTLILNKIWLWLKGQKKSESTGIPICIHNSAWVFFYFFYLGICCYLIYILHFSPCTDSYQVILLYLLF